MSPALLLASLAVASEPTAAEAAQRMQSFYERCTDLKAHFRQTYVGRALHQTLKSEGRMSFKKPGMIRFDYLEPEPKTFAVKGDRIISYVPAAQQAMEGSFKADQLSASVTFLWGRGNLAREFRLSLADRSGLGADLGPGIALHLEPLHPDPRFQELTLLLDPKTWAVRATLVIDGAGNQNRFEFTDLKTNTGLTAKDFDFTPPPGTEIVNLGTQ
jgi:outer membrane lipoprotein carrier protein